MQGVLAALLRQGYGRAGRCLLQFAYFFVGRMFTTCSAMLGQSKLFGRLGFVALGDVVEIAANGAF